VECQYVCAAALVIIFIAIKLTPSLGLRNVFTDERAAHCSLHARNYTVPSLLWQFFPLHLRLRETSILNEEICKPYYQRELILPEINAQNYSSLFTISAEDAITFSKVENLSIIHSLCFQTNNKLCLNDNRSNRSKLKICMLFIFAHFTNSIQSNVFIPW
jgi:hypothetical protein